MGLVAAFVPQFLFCGLLDVTLDLFLGDLSQLAVLHPDSTYSFADFCPATRTFAIDQSLPRAELILAGRTLPGFAGGSRVAALLATAFDDALRTALGTLLTFLDRRHVASCYFASYFIPVEVRIGMDVLPDVSGHVDPNGVLLAGMRALYPADFLPEGTDLIVWLQVDATLGDRGIESFTEHKTACDNSRIRLLECVN